MMSVVHGDVFADRTFSFVNVLLGMNHIMKQSIKQSVALALAAFWVCGVSAQVGTEQTSSNQSAYRKLGTQNVGVEVMGSTGLVGVSYDARFRSGSNSGWGFRTGLNYSLSAFGRSKSEPDTWDYTFTGGCGVPVEINYLTGPLNHHFEVGLGCTLGVYRDEWEEVVGYSYDRIEKYSRTAFGYYGYCNVGYRYQRPNGLMLRVGISPQFGITKGVDLPWPFSPLYRWPYVAAGWTF